MSFQSSPSAIAAGDSNIIKNSIARNNNDVDDVDNDDDVLLFNFHDAVLYQRDLNLLLHEKGWLNDSIIHFYFEYLQQQQTPSNWDYFMDPSVVSFFMHQCIDTDDIQEFVQSAPFPRPTARGTRGRIFIPVNDYMMPSSSSSSSTSWSSSLLSSAQGTHWTLLVLDIQVVVVHDDKDRPFILAHHFDSLVSANTNHLVARKIFEKILIHVYQQHPHGPTSSLTSATTCVGDDANVFFWEASDTCIPQQVNGYDCGVHVLGAAEILSSRSNNDNNNTISYGIDSTTSTLSFGVAQLQKDDNEQVVQLHIGSDPAKFCTDLRKKIASIILQLRNSNEGCDIAK